MIRAHARTEDEETIRIEEADYTLVLPASRERLRQALRPVVGLLLKGEAGRTEQAEAVESPHRQR